MNSSQCFNKMNETYTDILISSEPILYRYMKLCLFAILEVPSVLISIYILYINFSYRKFRSRLRNHSIIGLILLSLIETTTELPIALQYLHLGYVKPNNSRFCLFWIWYNFSLQTTNLSLMTWTSIERHIFIFHSKWFQTSYGKWIYHYIPLIISTIYIPIFYFICVILYQCDNNFDYSLFLCGSICYNNVTWLSSFDWMTNMLIPSLLIPIINISLLVRVTVQIKKVKRILKWRTARKMTIQSLIISTLYLLFWTPLALVSLIRIYFIPTFIDDITFYYLNYTPYLVQLLMPFVCIICLTEVWPKKNRINVM
ncbi:unnamed protein product [Adineta steineri]|uniref:G-protein coupled receptors family 1 profile domain-containing protein n=1 Tax=Adineta steineri TaxID=433720 RepID=A0A819PU80_9BILA|nr:unnamed protein product [Adineta steineri]CAF4018556.1 unnamed protein product [Adineta steineri]